MLKFDKENPIRSKCILRTLTKIYDNNLSSANEDYEEQEDNLLAPQLAITNRFLYQAFGKDYRAVSEICKSLEDSVAVQLVSESKLLYPIYPSKSMVIATNLLNSMFDTVLKEMGISIAKQKQFFTFMGEAFQFQTHRVVCTTDFVTTKGYINSCFPTKNPSPAIMEQPFF